MCLNNLNDEYRCDFLVNKSRKKLWKIELEMLVWVNKICDDNNLNYFLLGGSAIGAIRHKGFIPWDDDLDIGMFRSDFNKFIEIINNLDGFPYFIQYGQNDNGKISSLLRIRDSSSTGILREDFNRNCNNGIFIEIYPFDNVPDNYLARKLQFTLSYVLYHGMHAYYYGSSSVKQFFGKILVIIIGYERTYDIWQKNNQKFNNLDCQYVDTVSLPYYYRKGIHRFKKEWINNYCKVPFEKICARISMNSDEMIKLEYIDYLDLPPKEIRGKHHDYLVFYDPTKPFSFYDNNIKVEKYFQGIGADALGD